MQKIGAHDESELTTIFGVGDICLKSKVTEVKAWLNKQHQKRVEWLQSLPNEEKAAIIEYELYNHECLYTWKIGSVLDLLEETFGYDLIITVCK